MVPKWCCRNCDASICLLSVYLYFLSWAPFSPFKNRKIGGKKKKNKSDEREIEKSGACGSGANEIPP